jgi:hypothetical protein
MLKKLKLKSKINAIMKNNKMQNKYSIIIDSNRFSSYSLLQGFYFYDYKSKVYIAFEMKVQRDFKE